jgi:hypothetical protein
LFFSASKANFEFKVLIEMVSIKGIYDGSTITPLEPVPKNKSFKVIITFIEEIDSENMVSEPEFRAIGNVANGFSFWENEEEDIYQDYLETKTNQ